MLDLVERRKLSDVVVDRIKDYIATNDLKPGDRLPTEHALAAFNDLFKVFFQRFRESVNRGQWKSGIERHQVIIDALRKGNVRVAADELRRHIESHRKYLETGTPGK